MRLRLVMLLLLAPLPASPQGFSLAGRVVDASSGIALARTTVSIRPVEEPRQRGQAQQPVDITTGPDGSFHFDGLPAGRYQLQGARRGYLTSALEQHDRLYAAVVVGAGHSESAHIRFALTALASIRGSVLDSSGDPVQSALINLFELDTDGSGTLHRRQTIPLERGSSTYAFDNLAPGTYYLAFAGHPWFAAAQAARDGSPSPLDLAYPVTYYDGAESSVAAQPIALKAGESALVNATLHAVAAVHLALPTAQQGGSFQFPQISVPAFGSSVPLGASGVVSRDEAQATLTLSVAPGVYLVQSREGSATIQASADTDLPGGLQLPPASSLSGKVAMADGSALVPRLSLRLIAERSPADAPDPLQNFRFRGNAPRDDAGVHERGGAFGQRPIELSLLADGSFSAGAVPAGDYRLVAGAGSSHAVVTGAAISGGQYATSGVLHLGGEPAMLAVTVAVANGTVAGRVLDSAGRPQPGVLVLLVPRSTAAEPQRLLLPLAQESDSDGSWSLTDLAPGSYTAVAIDRGWDLPWTQPNALARYLTAGGLAVTVTANTLTALPAPLRAQPR